jgi:hypothetical protein
MLVCIVWVWWAENPLALWRAPLSLTFSLLLLQILIGSTALLVFSLSTFD